MGWKLTVGVVAAASTGLTGCMGVPMVVSAASLYVDAVLVLRTNKTVTDHVISAVAERDCAVLNAVLEGRLCTDAPAPDLLAELTREVETVPPPGTQSRIEVASATPLVLSDTVAAPGASPLPPVETAAPRPPAPILVMAGSFTNRTYAEARLAGIAHPTAAIVEATVSGRHYYRVVIRPADREDAMRQLALVRAGGVKDAWLSQG